MQKVVTAAEMREIDRLTTERHAVPSLLLMEAAADAAAHAVASLLPEKFPNVRVLILCGRGNNGGDGAALARVRGYSSRQASSKSRRGLRSKRPAGSP